MSVVDFFKKPFTESVDPHYMKQMVFNNFPPMKLKISVNSLALVLLSRFDTLEDNNALTLLTSITFTQEGLGDANVGPGVSGMSVEAFLKRLLFINSKDIFGKPNQRPVKTEEYQNTFSLIESFKIYFSTVYTLPYYLKYRSVPATFDLKLELKNNKKLVNNFVLSTDHLNLLQKVISNVLSSTGETREEVIPPPKLIQNPSMEPEVVSTYLIKINRIRINIIKMVQGMELLHVRINRTILRARQVKNLYLIY